VSAFDVYAEQNDWENTIAPLYELFIYRATTILGAMNNINNRIESIRLVADTGMDPGAMDALAVLLDQLALAKIVALNALTLWQLLHTIENKMRAIRVEAVSDVDEAEVFRYVAAFNEVSMVDDVLGTQLADALSLGL
jgi:hypothetical protein